MIHPVTEEIIDQQPIAEQCSRMRKSRASASSGRLETALEADDRAPRAREARCQPWRDAPNGTRRKTVLTEVGPVEIQVPA